MIISLLQGAKAGFGCCHNLRGNSHPNSLYGSSIYRAVECISFTQTCAQETGTITQTRALSLQFPQKLLIHLLSPLYQEKPKKENKGS